MTGSLDSGRSSRASAATLSAVLLLVLTACNGSSSHQAGTAPNMDGDAMPTQRNVANPNAPFTLRPEAPHLARRQPVLDVNDAPVCAESQLSVFETRSRVHGSEHTLRLTFENQGEPCRLSGFPAVTLLGPNGSVLDGVAVQKVSPQALAAFLGAATAATEPPTDAGTPSPEVLLVDHGNATFELGWTSGDDCPQVVRLAVSAPGNTQPSYVPRQLAVCHNNIQITAVEPAGSD